MISFKSFYSRMEDGGDIEKKYGEKFVDLAKSIGAVYPLDNSFEDDAAFTTKVNDDDPSAEMVIKPNFDDENSVILETIFVPEKERNKGLGNEMMKKFLYNVDRLKMSVKLTIDPKSAVRGTHRSNEDEIPMDIEQLRNWYKGFGFIFKKYGANDFSTIGIRPSLVERENQNKESLPQLPPNFKLKPENYFVDGDRSIIEYFKMGNEKLKALKKQGYYAGPLFIEGETYYSNSVYTVKNGKLLKHNNTRIDDSGNIENLD